MRPRFTVAGGKSDSFDAFVLAALARNDSHRFPVLVPDLDQTKALRAFSRAREDLVDQRVALANEPRAQLESCRPGAAHEFAEGVKGAADPAWRGGGRPSCRWGDAAVTLWTPPPTG
jgi:transposase